MLFCNTTEEWMLSNLYSHSDSAVRLIILPKCAPRTASEISHFKERFSCIGTRIWLITEDPHRPHHRVRPKGEAALANSRPFTAKAVSLWWVAWHQLRLSDLSFCYDYFYSSLLRAVGVVVQCIVAKLIVTFCIQLSPLQRPQVEPVKWSRLSSSRTAIR